MPSSICVELRRVCVCLCLCMFVVVSFQGHIVFVSIVCVSLCVGLYCIGLCCVFGLELA